MKLKIIILVILVVIMGGVIYYNLPDQDTSINTHKIFYEFKDKTSLNNSICEQEGVCDPWEACLTYHGRSEPKTACKEYFNKVINYNEKESCYAFNKAGLKVYCLRMLGYTNECTSLAEQESVSNELCICEIDGFRACKNKYGDLVSPDGNTARTTQETCYGLNGKIVEITNEIICPENMKPYGQISGVETIQICCVK